MLDEVVSFILAAPVDSTSEVLDECAVPSDFLFCKVTGLPCKKKNNLILKIELTFQKQTGKLYGVIMFYGRVGCFFFFNLPNSAG